MMDVLFFWLIMAGLVAGGKMICELLIMGVSSADSLPEGKSVPQLPARTECLGDGPYRTPSLVPAETAEQERTPRVISFERFVEYWRSVGLPDKPEDSREFRKLAERIDFGSKRRFAAFLTAEISKRYENHESVCREFRGLALSNILISAVAVRNRETDVELLRAVMEKVAWTEQYYVLIEAIGRVWPVSPEAIRAVAKMTEWRRRKDLDGTHFVNLAARDVLSGWRRRDPEGFLRRSQEMLK